MFRNSLLLFLFAFLASFVLHAQFGTTNYGTSSGTSGNYNSNFGYQTGTSNTNGSHNTLIGYRAGYNTTGVRNTFLGSSAGYDNTGGGYNTFIGNYTGPNNTTGSRNTFLGYAAGYTNKTGGRNVFIGTYAGYYEKGDNKLYIDNTSTGNPLIYGDFLDNTLTFNGKVGVNGVIPSGGSVPTDIKLYVSGRFSQKVSGTLGGFGTYDLWSSLGTSFAPGNVPKIYGMLNQGYGTTFISGVKDNNNATVAWAGSGNLDFDFIGSGGALQNAMTLTPSGTLNIGTTNSSSYRLNVGGSTHATSNWVSSDKRYKKNVKTIDSALDKINALNGVTYNFNQKVVNDIDFAKLKQGNHLGFIAQDLEEVFPELVQKDEAGYHSVNYDGLIPVLVEAVKEQQDVIDEQEEEMLQQEEQITDLRTRLDKLEALLNNTENTQSSISVPNQNVDISGVVLRQNMPNPLRDKTTIEYQIPDNLGTASLIVYDLNGRSIATYNVVGKGFVEFDASRLSNGTYAYAIVVDGKSIAGQKMVIQR